MFSFLKEKKLIGEHTLELVQKIKSESWLTIEESYNKLNNVKSNAIFNKKKKEKRSEKKEYLAQEMAEKLEDDHSLRFYRKIADLVPENLIYQALSGVKDAFLTGRVKKSRAALFTTIIQAKALEHNINLDIKKSGI